MQIKYRQYPHPVLAYFSDDLVKCAFQSTIKTVTTTTAYKFNAICVTSSRDLNKLIKDNKAQYAFHVECASTRFRELFCSFEKEFSFEVPADKLNGRVEICSFILAAEDIPKYKNQNFNEDYDGTSFRIRKGDVLAVDRDRSFIADKETDPLKKIPSIFTVSVDTSRNAPPLDIDATGNKVVIKLSKENFERYKMLKMNQNLHAVLASLLITPALISLLEMIKTEGAQVDEYEERRWYRALINKLKNIGIDISASNSFTDSSIVVAQRLIGDSLTSSLKNLEGYESED